MNFNANFLIAKKEMIEINEQTTFIDVAEVISAHMGQRNTNKYSKTKLPLPKTEMQKFVHLIDYLDSRKFFDLEMVEE